LLGRFVLWGADPTVAILATCRAYIRESRGPGAANNSHGAPGPNNGTATASAFTGFLSIHHSILAKKRAERQGD
jgi:hypothetical protein